MTHERVVQLCAGAHNRFFLYLSFSSRRVQVDGSVDGHPVSNITVTLLRACLLFSSDG